MVPFGAMTRRISPNIPPKHSADKDENQQNADGFSHRFLLSAPRFVRPIEGTISEALRDVNEMHAFRLVRSLRGGDCGTNVEPDEDFIVRTILIAYLLRGYKDGETLMPEP